MQTKHPNQASDSESRLDDGLEDRGKDSRPIARSVTVATVEVGAKKTAEQARAAVVAGRTETRESVVGAKASESGKTVVGAEASEACEARKTSKARETRETREAGQSILGGVCVVQVLKLGEIRAGKTGKTGQIRKIGGGVRSAISGTGKG